jgi:hypothetical protein
MSGSSGQGLVQYLGRPFSAPHLWEGYFDWYRHAQRAVAGTRRTAPAGFERFPPEAVLS